MDKGTLLHHCPKKYDSLKGTSAAVRNFKVNSFYYDSSYKFIIKEFEGMEKSPMKIMYEFIIRIVVDNTHYNA